MLTQDNYERYIHYKNHINNQNINYIRLFNCKYCKQDRRDYYGSRFRTPNNINRNRNIDMNLLNYSRVQNIIGPVHRNQTPRYIPTRSNPIRSNGNPIITNSIPRRSNPIITNIIPRSSNPIITNSIPRRSNPIITSSIPRRSNPIITNSIPGRSNPIITNSIPRRSNPIITNSIPRRSNPIITSSINLPRQTNFIQRNIRRVRQIGRRTHTPYSVLRNNYIYGNNLTRRNTINLTYFRDSMGIQPLSDDEIEDFEELTDMEVKTTLEEVNKGCSIEIYNEEKKDYCSICCEDIVKSQIIRKMKCEHNFHYKCLDEWLETNKKCPLCRFSI